MGPEVLMAELSRENENLRQQRDILLDIAEKAIKNSTFPNKQEMFEQVWHLKEHINKKNEK